MSDYLDALSLLGLLVALVVVVACWELHPIQWLREEWRLAWKHDFWPTSESAEHMVNPALGSTRADVNVAHMEALQYQAGERMRREGDHMLDYKYVPEPFVLKK